MLTLILIALAGAAANLVDGGIGMGFGVTSTTMLLLAGLGPAQASAVVHTAELGTTAISGLSHARFGNVDWKTVVRLGVPGGIAAFVGATLLSNISTAAAAPVTALILVGIGANLIWRFAQPRRRGSAYKRSHSTPFLAGLGLVADLSILPVAVAGVPCRPPRLWPSVASSRAALWARSTPPNSS